MNKEQILADIQALNGLIVKINQREQAAINELNRLHIMLFGEAVRATCSNCHIKAFHMLTSLTYNDLLIMEKVNFKIKKGSRIEYPYRGGHYYTADSGISDEAAREMLINHPEYLEYFDVYPGSDGEDKKLRLELIGGQQAAETAPVKKAGKGKKAKAVENEPPVEAASYDEVVSKYKLNFAPDNQDEETAVLTTLTESADWPFSYTEKEQQFMVDRLDELTGEEGGEGNDDQDPEKAFGELLGEAPNYSRMNKKDLTAAYKTKFGIDPAEDTTNKVLIKALTSDQAIQS